MHTEYEFIKSRFEGIPEFLPSKSFFQRIVLCEAYYKGRISSSNFLLKSVDMILAYNVALSITKGENIFYCLDDATLFRLLLPMQLAKKRKSVYIISKRLFERGNKEYFDLLICQGAEFSVEERIDGNLSVIVSGCIKSGIYEISCNVSSQFLSGLLMALPLLKEKSTIKLISQLSSSGYVDITINVLQNYGIHINKSDSDSIYYVEPFNDILFNNSNSNIMVENDWSTNAMWLTAGAINGNIEVQNLNLRSMQPDKAIVDILTQMNVSIEINENCIKVNDKNLIKRLDYDFNECPDIALAVALLCSCAEGVSCLKNLNRLQYKESNRLNGIINMLSALDIKTTYDKNCLFIYGAPNNRQIYKKTIHSTNDHRLAMIAAIAGAKYGNILLSNPACTEKSYIDFYKEFKRLGGIYNVIGLG